MASCSECHINHCLSTVDKGDNEMNLGAVHISWHNIEKSAIASHFWNSAHEIDNSAILLKSVNKRDKLVTWKKGIYL